MRVKHVEQVGAAGGERGQVAEGVVEVLPAAVVDDLLELGDPQPERVPRGLVEGRQDLVDLDRLLHVRVGQPAAVGQVTCVLAAGGELDVRLA